MGGGNPQINFPPCNHQITVTQLFHVESYGQLWESDFYGFPGILSSQVKKATNCKKSDFPDHPDLSRGALEDVVEELLAAASLAAGRVPGLATRVGRVGAAVGVLHEFLGGV